MHQSLRLMTAVYRCLTLSLVYGMLCYVVMQIGVRYYEESLEILPKQRRILFLQCLFGFASVAFGFYAMSKMILADASVIIFTSPVVTFVFVSL